MAIVVRPAKPADIYLIEQWGRALYEVERTFEPHMRYLGDSYRERDVKQLANPDALYLIAELNAQPVGYLSASVTDMPEYLALPGRECTVEVIYLEAFARGKGVADKLVNACFNRLQQIDVERVKVGVYARNEASLKLFERFGFQPHHVTMIKAFD